MLTQDISSHEPRSVRLITVDVVQRFREQWNRSIEKSTDVFSLEIPFPEDFIRSGRRKFIGIIGFRVIWSNSLPAVGDGVNLYPDECINIPNDTISADDFKANLKLTQPPHISLHASFVQDSYNDNQLICFNSEYLIENRKYEIYTNQRSFKIWFVDLINRVRMSLRSICDRHSSIIIQYILYY